MHANTQNLIHQINHLESDHFFNNAILCAAKAVTSDYLFVAKINNVSHSSRTICLAAKDKIIDNVEYDLKYTPCSNVADDAICCYPQEVTKLFPLDELLIDMGIDAYIGSPLKNNSGEVIGLIVALFEKGMDNTEEVTDFFSAITTRIEKELIN